MQDQCTPSPLTKRCTKCGETKPVDAFGLSHGQPRRYCHDCERDIARRRRIEHPGAAAAARRRWCERYPERAAAADAKSRAKHRERIFERQRAWRAENRDKVTASGQRYYLEHREQALQKARRWNARNPERAALSKAATDKVRTAIQRGILARPSACEECGISGKRIEAAHHDYTRPLDVRWLCVPCHRRWDATKPKTLHG
jgi:hypothetical protein